MLPFLLLISGVLSAAVSVSSPAHWFIFGDSFTKTLFNWHLAQPNDVNPFGNPALPGITACGLVPNFVYFASVKYNTTTIYTYNLSQGGATINATIVPPSSPVIQTFVDQITTFQASYTGPSPLNRIAWMGNNSMFLVWIGINDVNTLFFNNSPATLSAVQDELIVSYYNNLQRLFDLGARNFVVLNVPPTDRCPQVLHIYSPQFTIPNHPQILTHSKIYQDIYRTGVDGFNAKLIKGVAAFRLANPDASLWIVDTNSPLNNVLNDPAPYGFVDAVSYGAEPNVAWCNSFHISPGLHDFVAQGIQASLNGSGLI